MRLTRQFSLTLILVLAPTNILSAKPWRGITPLRSNRAFVERLLGKPEKTESYASYYSLRDEIAVVWFQDFACDEPRRSPGGWNVPDGTVTAIGVIPKTRLSRDAFLEENQLELEKGSAGFQYYSNEANGFTIEIYNGVVTALNYLPGKESEDIRCPLPEGIFDFFPKFDEYKGLSWADETARLDNYADQMIHYLSRGTIVVYGTDPGSRKKLMKRATRALGYLRHARAIERGRVLVLDGGYRSESVTELNLYPIGGERGRLYLFRENAPGKMQ